MISFNFENWKTCVSIVYYFNDNLYLYLKRWIIITFNIKDNKQNKILLVCHLCDEFNDEILDDINALGVGILVITEAIHHAS